MFRNLLFINHYTKKIMFRELYYWMYQYLRKIRTNDTPAINAYFLICLLQILNIGTLIVLTRYLLKTNASIDISTCIDKSIATYIGIGLTVVLLAVNYFLLYSRRNEIFKQFDSLAPARRVRGNIFFWLYAILSFVLLFVLGPTLGSPTY
jgi:hypothetical protein